MKTKVKHVMTKGATYAYDEAAEMVLHSSMAKHLVLQCYEFSLCCFVNFDCEISKSEYLNGFYLFIEMDDFDGAEQYLDKVIKNIEKRTNRLEIVSDFYNKVINIYEEKVEKDLSNQFINKYKFKHAQYLFVVEEYDKVSHLLQEVIKKNRKSNCDQKLTESSCVYACLVAILTDGPDAQGQIDNICNLWSDFEECKQYSVVNSIVESLQNNDIGGLEKAVKSLSIDKDKVAMFNARVMDLIET
ncbi:hypothetical protein RF11_16034 [Thelohanellus kitauei]|uniref:Gamma-soluble NSF attachment protein n=1 Tax=Thelohanellus kitauei TaxID=669202 RepID=A0A0C2MHG2_THEKT|nr:hypothetical protein RF11_16034 [Thelohanellus kitauei]